MPIDCNGTVAPYGTEQFVNQWNYHGEKLKRKEATEDKPYWQNIFVGKVLNPLLEDLQELIDCAPNLDNSPLQFLCGLDAESDKAAIKELKAKLAEDDNYETKSFGYSYWASDISLIASYKKMKCWSFIAVHRDYDDESSVSAMPPAYKSRELADSEDYYRWVRLNYVTTTADCISHDLNPLALYGPEHSEFKEAVKDSVHLYPHIVWNMKHFYLMPGYASEDGFVSAMHDCIGSLADKIIECCFTEFEKIKKVLEKEKKVAEVDLNTPATKIANEVSTLVPTVTLATAANEVDLHSKVEKAVSDEVVDMMDSSSVQLPTPFDPV